ncbi:MAG: hypothetical protein ACRD8O_15695 [Bryobacteraceae bacterium]
MSPLLSYPVFAPAGEAAVLGAMPMPAAPPADGDPAADLLNLLLSLLGDENNTEALPEGLDARPRQTLSVKSVVGGLMRMAIPAVQQAPETLPPEAPEVQDSAAKFAQPAAVAEVLNDAVQPAPQWSAPSQALMPLIAPSAATLQWNPTRVPQKTVSATPQTITEAVSSELESESETAEPVSFAPASLEKIVLPAVSVPVEAPTMPKPASPSTHAPAEASDRPGKTGTQHPSTGAPAMPETVRAVNPNHNDAELAFAARIAESTLGNLPTAVEPPVQSREPKSTEQRPLTTSSKPAEVRPVPPITAASLPVEVARPETPSRPVLRREAAAVESKPIEFGARPVERPHAEQPAPDVEVDSAEPATSNLDRPKAQLPNGDDTASNKRRDLEPETGSKRDLTAEASRVEPAEWGGARIGLRPEQSHERSGGPARMPKPLNPEVVRAATEHADMTLKPSSRPTTARELSVVMPGRPSPVGTAEPVTLRVVERAGELHVAVRTHDAPLSHDLRYHIQQLSTRLEQAGFESEIWRPSEGATLSSPLTAAQTHASAGDSASQQDRPDGSQKPWERQGGSSRQDARDGGRKQDRPRWVEELEESSRGKRY